MLTVQTFVNSPVASNCYVMFDKELGNECFIVDSGCKSEQELIDYLDGNGLVPRYIILTHEHFDHCWGVNELVERYHIPIISSELCAEAIKNEKRNCSVFYDNKCAFTINTEVVGVESLGDCLRFDNTTIRFFHTLGHTKASISFLIGQYLFTGDMLIKDESTITKLPTGSISDLLDSIAFYKSMQGKGYIVCPGHGASFLLDEYDLNKMK